MNLLGVFFPTLARRWQTYQFQREYRRMYEAAQPSQWRPVVANLTSGDGVMNATGTKLRELARHLDENHDLVVAVFDDLVNNIVGACVSVSPMIRRADGTLAEEANDRVGDWFDEWSQSPETSGQLGREAMDRLICRSYLRDGEIFLQKVAGGSFRYQTPVPFVLEMLEADLVPFLLNEPDKNILHGIQHDTWNTPIGYYVLKNHPGDPLGGMGASAGLTLDTKRIPAEAMIHLKFTRRIRQRRGVPIIHAVLNRMRDLKDYEESERIAAKVAADLTAFLKRGSEYQGVTDVNDYKNRALQLSAGSIIPLLPGEDIGMVKSDRPNTALNEFRSAMLRAVAGGTGTRYSSIARDYNGTYSAQRQELVEGTVGYRAHFAYLVRQYYRPVYTAWMERAVLSGVLAGERNIDRTSIYRADFRAPALPWIDPQKEAAAWQLLVEAKLESRQEIMRSRGRDPAKVYEELEQEQAEGVFAEAVDAGADYLGEFGAEPKEEAA